ncbi:hypothetical protein PISMIDRAFT_89895 [Pisolithus microcarpus 441]|uniref:Uncharacterized protein n=1 Tax=Pisolithus microcarpus 441 TaxID=765257 RepID=A0A0C9YVL7_9AGAM|nr:hypothetical protein PISMIDRAFT_89895 [Pisolithus microcarpus 441]
MVTQNVETDLDITNGARGIIVDIVLHPEEPIYSDLEGTVLLQRLPSYILVKLARTRTSQLPGLEASVIPVVPVCKTYGIRYKGAQGVDVTRRVRRLQYPVTAAYIAGQTPSSPRKTISHVVVDIARLPTSGLNLFNLYVALSRSSGCATIRLLRDFDEKLFLSTHTPDLLTEDDRLADLDKQTKAWWAQQLMVT